VSEAAEYPIPLWDQRRSAPTRWYLAPLILLILAIFCGDALGLAFALDDRVGDGVVRDSVRVPGTVTAIHVRDDFVRPSVVEVTLQHEVDGRRTVATRTTDEDTYSVGERVPVEVDLRNPGLSAVVGDENGPTWTLGAETVAIAAGVLLSISSLITAIVNGSIAWNRRRPSRPAHPQWAPWTPPPPFPTGIDGFPLKVPQHGDDQ
jgi:hypothetical protein